MLELAAQRVQSLNESFGLCDVCIAENHIAQGVGHREGASGQRVVFGFGPVLFGPAAQTGDNGVCQLCAIGQKVRRRIAEGAHADRQILTDTGIERGGAFLQGLLRIDVLDEFCQQGSVRLGRCLDNGLFLFGLQRGLALFFLPGGFFLGLPCFFCGFLFFFSLLGLRGFSLFFGLPGFCGFSFFFSLALFFKLAGFFFGLPGGFFLLFSGLFFGLTSSFGLPCFFSLR